MEKFNRSYKFFIDTNDGGQLEIGLPFSIDFNVVRNTLSSANTAIFRIYNLNETNRRRIAKDKYDFDLFKRVIFLGGYENDVPSCFNGSVTRCYSVREGTNVVTTIEAFDAGFAHANATLKNAQYPSGTLRKSIIEDMILKLKDFGIEKGVIGDIKGSISRGNSYDGPIIKTLSELTGGAFFIDNGEANVLSENETRKGNLQVITSESGLLGTPIRENATIEFDMIFEPRLVIGQKILINSKINTDVNQAYKITSLAHQGMISDSVAGSATTKSWMLC